MAKHPPEIRHPFSADGCLRILHGPFTVTPIYHDGIYPGHVIKGEDGEEVDQDTPEFRAWLEAALNRVAKARAACYRLRDSRLALGVCVQCGGGREGSTSKSYCAGCYAQVLLTQKNRRKRKERKGLKP